MLAAATALSAAELPAHVPTYRGTKPAAKAVPRSVPSYRVQPAIPTVPPHLVRPGMNAPRPGVAVPGNPPTTRQRSQKTAQSPRAGADRGTNPKY